MHVGDISLEHTMNTQWSAKVLEQVGEVLAGDGNASSQPWAPVLKEVRGCMGFTTMVALDAAVELQQQVRRPDWFSTTGWAYTHALCHRLGPRVLAALLLIVTYVVDMAGPCLGV